MKILFIILLILFIKVSLNTASEYAESYDDMLIQCNMYVKNIPKVRNKHLCEKDNFDDDFIYYIAILKTAESDQNFLCVNFIKFEETNLRFKIWFSHKNFSINALGIKNADIVGDSLESNVKFKRSSLIVVPTGDFQVPQIFGFELNGIEVCPFCGQRIEDAAVGLIKGGTQVGVNHKYPWHATIFHYEESSLSYKCGGTVIRDNKILTAAHCVTRNDQKLHENKLIVRFEEGELLSSSRYQFKVLKSLVHELYNYETYENDIALLVLETSLDILHSTSIRAACLPTNGMKFKGEGYVVGFGSTERHVTASKIFLETKLPVVRKDICRDRDPSYYGKYMFDTNFCAGRENFGVCSGDSGGGFVIQHEGLWILKGIISNTKQNKNPSAINPTCSDENFALFTDVEKYLDWIVRRLKDTDLW